MARAAIILLSATLVTTLTVIGVSYQRLVVPLSYERDQPLIDRSFDLAAKAYGAKPSGLTPIVTRHGRPETTCVDLRSSSHQREGSFSACYDVSGKLIEQVAGPVF